MIFDFTEMTGNEIYHKMTESIVPRPVAWVLSENSDHSYNLAPFSYFNAISSTPPLISLSIGKKRDGELKDSRRNILERKHFTLHIAHADLAQAVTDSAKPFAENESELSTLNLETIHEEGFSLPRLKYCRIAFDCTLEEVVQIASIPQALIIARIQKVYVADEVLCEGKIKSELLNPLARLGGNEFATLGKVFSINPST